MDISAETLQGFLDDAWDVAGDVAGSLRTQLRLYETTCSKKFNVSGTLGSVSKNSASQSYRGPGLGSYTLPQIQTAWRTLINLYDQELDRANWLNAIQDVWFTTKYPKYAADADGAVYDFMKKRLLPIETFEEDFSDLRLHPTTRGDILQTW